MHMADALLSPAVGGSMWVVSAGAIAYCSKKVSKELDDKKIPLMGVMGAFLFAAQMINFTIPATGSSGHLGGGLLLSIILGPYAAFLTIASVLVVQALFFADGGILALGCNIFNMGFIPAFIAYPLIYKKIIGDKPTQFKITAATIISAIAGLQLGPFSVVLETTASGISSLPFSTFILLMLPIHLAIGMVEGFVTAAIVAFVNKAHPEILVSAHEAKPIGVLPIRNILIVVFTLAVITGGVVSWFASENPDGLEWAIKKVTGKEEVEPVKDGIHGILSSLQDKIAFLPDYNFKQPGAAKETTSSEVSKNGSFPAEPVTKSEVENKKSDSKLGTSVAGLVGGILTLALTFFTGFVLRRLALSRQN